MNEDNDDKWNNLQIDLLITLAERLDFPGKIKFSAVSKSWKSAAFISEVPLPKAPYLLLAEATGAAPTVDDYDDEKEEENTNNDVDGDEEKDEKVVKSRGIFCLSTAKTYNIELPEASGKLILGTNKGWLLTLRRDLKINLLHPFPKKQILLPPMLTSRDHEYDDASCTRESNCFHNFITKAVMSSTIPTHDDDNHPLPVVMAIYGRRRILGFARPGDELWTDVNVKPSKCFEDITFHKNKFYAVNYEAVFMCEIDDDDERGPRGTKIASLPREDNTSMQWYLVESSSGHDLLLIMRFRRAERSQHMRYYTSEFLLWKLEYSEHDELGNWIPVTNLGNESLFIGKTSSFLVSSSETIKPNCVYFTDDSNVYIGHKGGVVDHDTGIFSMEHGTMESHFTGKSTHPFSPPLWYI